MSLDSEFFTGFNGALPEMEAQFGEDWIHQTTDLTWPAIAIDTLSVSSKVMKGGQFIEAHTAIFVRLEVFTDSGVKKGDIVTARDQDLSVLSIESDGDDSRTLICGPYQIDAGF